MRPAALYAALGLLTAGLFAAALELLAGPRITGGLGAGWRALPGPTVVQVGGNGHPALVPLLPVALGCGLLVALLLWPTGRVLRGPRLLVLSVTGVVVGVVIAVGTHLWRWNGSSFDTVAVYHGRYVPLGGSTGSTAYGSTLSITIDRQPWWPLLLTGAVAGLAAGLLGWAGERAASSPGT